MTLSLVLSNRKIAAGRSVSSLLGEDGMEIKWKRKYIKNRLGNEGQIK